MHQRRQFLKAAGTALLSISAIPVDGLAAKTPGSAQPAMVIDLDRCTGCQACVIACREHAPAGPEMFRTRISISEDGIFPKARKVFRPLVCRQCEKPVCVDVCQYQATFSLANGIVVVDTEHCVGCGRCVEACPYGARFVDPETSVADKCDFCRDRLNKGFEPVCVESCSSGARSFGDLKNPGIKFAKAAASAQRDPLETKTGRQRVLFTSQSAGGDNNR